MSKANWHNVWENPHITQINRYEAHTRWGACASFTDAASMSASKWITSLDGEYQFKLVSNPDEAGDFYLPGYDASGFSAINVPGNWETQGFGEPIYTNTEYPWNDEPGRHFLMQAKADGTKVYNPPYLPESNPTGCYRHPFTVPSEYLERDIFIRFEGVETAYILWINGEFVGYSEDSKLPSEFLINEYLRPGKNLLALQVMRFATGTWLEDQDYWYLSGIYRSVSLIAKPRLRIEDYQITAIPDLHGTSGYFTADINISRAKNFGDCQVKVTLLYNNEMKAESEGFVETGAEYTRTHRAGANSARVTFDVPDIIKWTPETPALYTVVFILIDGNGSELDFESCQIGFKKVEIKDGILLLNGKRLIIRGVNRHEHNPDGRTVSKEHMIEEIKEMKRMNISSIRTSHYPSSPLWFDLCDEFGVLLICECNLETHGVMGAISHNPAFANQYLERAVRMVQNFKNHVSIYSWSLGNESGHGANHAAMYGFIKEYDKTRICQYESGSPGKNISDIRGDMYMPIEGIMKNLCDPTDDRPIILIEYLYQICNSGGGANKFRYLAENFPRFQGGYVWDWQDKGLQAKTEGGTEFFAYGGDFNESYLDKSNPLFMTNNGLVLPDLRWKPVAHELKQVYAPIWVEKIYDANPWLGIFPRDVLVLKNRSFSESTTDYECEVYLKENGEVIASKIIELPHVEPGNETQIEAGIPHEVKSGCEYHLDVKLRRKKSLWFEQKGEALFYAQFEQFPGAIATLNREDNCIGKTAAPVVVESGNDINVTTGNLCIEFDKTTGQIISLSNDGKKLLSGGEPRFDRPRTGLDCKEGWIWYSETSVFHDTETKVLTSSITTSETKAIISFEILTETKRPNPITGRITYTITGKGIHVEYFSFIPSAYELVSRVGLRYKLPEYYSNLTYLGFGPNECYSDRMESATLGLYQSTVDLEHFPFSPPSENGGHVKTRWLTLHKNGKGLRFSGDSPFHFDVRRNTTEDYWQAKHDHELPKRDEIFLHIDAVHAPIGSNMSWSSGIERDKVPTGGGYYLGFWITPPFPSPLPPQADGS